MVRSSACEAMIPWWRISQIWGFEEIPWWQLEDFTKVEGVNSNWSFWSCRDM